MNIVRAVLITLVLLGGLTASGEGVAQVPPHPVGAICFTPEFWCFARPAGPPGSPCVCPSPQGFVGGVRG